MAGANPNGRGIGRVMRRKSSSGSRRGSKLMHFRAVTIIVLALSLTLPVAAFAQVTDPNKAARDRVNEGTVFIAGGSLGATYNALANDIGMVTSDDNLRVVSVTTST